MLSKPGAARKAPTPSQRRRKVVEENLDDVVRKLQRAPSNKACADCSSKLTQCVNLTHGTFVCMACSGVHREFNHKIKGIGHSSFTAEEVAMLREPTSGNEAVNAHYLARYSSSDRLKPPQNNNDLQHLREWIRTKYMDKYWCEDRGGRGGGGASKSGGKSKPKAKGERRQIMPKAKESPKSSQPAPAPVGDPFGFDDIASNSAAANDASWDAFGGPTQNSAAAFDADFGGMPATAPAAAPVPAPPASAPAPADFGGFGQQQLQQPTMVAMPPAGSPQQVPTQTAPAPQPTFQANFEQAPMAAAPVPSQPGQMQQGGFADFSQPQPQPQMSQPQPQPQVQMQQSQPHLQPSNAQGNGGFASFPSMPQPTQQQMQPQQNQSLGMPNQLGGGMGFGQAAQQPPQHQQAQMQMQQQGSNVSNDQSGFANFASVQQPPQPNQTPQMQQMQPAPATFQPPEQQVSMPQPSQLFQGNMQQGAGTMSQQGSTVSSGSEQPTGGQAEPPPAMGTSVSQLPPTEGESAAVNPNAFQSTDDDRKSAFDAFDGLSLEPTPAAYGGAAASEAGAPAAAPKKNLNFSQFQEGQQVVYSNGDGVALATITKVHYDDELHPYYTINLNGREKQTDDAHLSLPGESNQNAALASNGGGALLQETVSMLQKLNLQQLMHVRQLVATMVSGNNSQVAPSGQNQQLNMTINQQQTQQLDIPMAPMGGAPQPQQAPVSAPNQMPQQPSYGMGANVPAPAPAAPSGMPTSAPAQYSMQPQMGMGATPPSMPPPQQYSMQQQQLPNSGMQAQPMGMGTNPSGAPTLPTGMPPPPPAPSSGQLSMNGAPQPTMEAPAAPPAAVAPAPAMPPVEKEGNPFDFY